METVSPTVKGYEKAFVSLCRLLKTGCIAEDDYMILDVYANFAAGMNMNKLLKQITGKSVVELRENGFVKVILK